MPVLVSSGWSGWSARSYPARVAVTGSLSARRCPTGRSPARGTSASSDEPAVRPGRAVPRVVDAAGDVGMDPSGVVGRGVPSERIESSVPASSQTLVGVLRGSVIALTLPRRPTPPERHARRRHGGPILGVLTGSPPSMELSAVYGVYRRRFERTFRGQRGEVAAYVPAGCQRAGGQAAATSTTRAGDEFRCGFRSVSTHPINRTQGEHHDRYLHLRRLFQPRRLRLLQQSGDWGGYWGKQGPEFLDRRLASYSEEQRMVLGANTFREFLQMLARAPRSPR